MAFGDPGNSGPRLHIAPTMLPVEPGVRLPVNEYAARHRVTTTAVNNWIRQKRIPAEQFWNKAKTKVAFSVVLTTHRPAPLKPFGLKGRPGPGKAPLAPTAPRLLPPAAPPAAPRGLGHRPKK